MDGLGPEGLERDRREIGIFAPKLSFVDPIRSEAVVTHGGWRGEVPLWPFDRPIPTGLSNLLRGGSRFVPVESIYAVFEIKQTLNLTNLRHAADKVASVRRLSRTSAKIVDI